MGKAPGPLSLTRLAVVGIGIGDLGMWKNLGITPGDTAPPGFPVWLWTLSSPTLVPTLVLSFLICRIERPA